MRMPFLTDYIENNSKTIDTFTSRLIYINENLRIHHHLNLRCTRILLEKPNRD